MGLIEFPHRLYAENRETILFVVRCVTSEVQCVSGCWCNWVASRARGFCFHGRTSQLLNGFNNLLSHDV